VDGAGQSVRRSYTAGPPGRWLLGTAGYVLGIGVNVMLAIAALTALPRLRMRLRRVLGPPPASPPRRRR
jgi:membrane protein